MDPKVLLELVDTLRTMGVVGGGLMGAAATLYIVKQVLDWKGGAGQRKIEKEFPNWERKGAPCSLQNEISGTVVNALSGFEEQVKVMGHHVERTAEAVESMTHAVQRVGDSMRDVDTKVDLVRDRIEREVLSLLKKEN